MERLTEYHAGVAVIKDKTRQKEAMAKLAKLEELENIPKTVCDHYCKWPNMVPSQEYLDAKCKRCELLGLFELLT